MSRDRMRELHDELKKLYENKVLLFKVGNEYHAYYDDADLMRKVFGGEGNIRYRISEWEIATHIETLEIRNYNVQVLAEAGT